MLDSAFVLHRYPYKETSLLLKVFTRRQGLLSFIVKGVKRKHSDAYSVLQCFQPLAMDYQLKGEFGNLKQVERQGEAPVLQNEALYSAFYLNELLLALLHPHEAVPNIFDSYAHTLKQLEHHVELSLRVFELNLLKQLGILPPLHQDDAGQSIVEAQSYVVIPGQELRSVGKGMQVPEVYRFSGQDIKNVVSGTWSLESLKAAKRLCRVFIEHHTRGREFKSRELFTAAKRI